MKILDVDSPLMNGLTKFADLIIVDFLTILCCIPVITAGAALTALHYCTLKIVRNEEYGITKMYFHSFKQNLKQSTGIWLIMLLISAFIGFDLYIFYFDESTNGIISTLIFVVAFILILVFAAVFPVQARFYNTIPRTFRMAFAVAFSQFPKTLIIAVVSIVPFVLMFLLVPILPLILCFAFSGPAYLAAKFYDKPFKRLEDRYREAHPEEIVDEDEHIFSDEPLIGSSDSEQ